MASALVQASSRSGHGSNDTTTHGRGGPLVASGSAVRASERVSLHSQQVRLKLMMSAALTRAARPTSSLAASDAVQQSPQAERCPTIAWVRQCSPLNRSGRRRSRNVDFPIVESAVSVPANSLALGFPARVCQGRVRVKPQKEAQRAYASSQASRKRTRC